MLPKRSKAARKTLKKIQNDAILNKANAPTPFPTPPPLFKKGMVQDAEQPVFVQNCQSQPNQTENALPVYTSVPPVYAATCLALQTSGDAGTLKRYL